MNPGQRSVRAIGFVAALVPLLGGLARAADLPQWDLAKLEGLDSAQWAPPETDGAETFRAVKAGKTGVWKVPAWWASGLPLARPDGVH
jgi:hypothetical protein